MDTVGALVDELMYEASCQHNSSDALASYYVSGRAASAFSYDKPLLRLSAVMDCNVGFCWNELEMQLLARIVYTSTVEGSPQEDRRPEWGIKAANISHLIHSTPDSRRLHI